MRCSFLFEALLGKGRGKLRGDGKGEGEGEGEVWSKFCGYMALLIMAYP